jgi:RHS repeat-associated protein
MAGTEFQTSEWGLEGLDLNYFAARYYDPILARWHAPDPLEQCHSPYLAMLGDPTNFVDPDGRAGIPFLQDFVKSDGGTFPLNLAGQAVFLGAMLSPLGSIGGMISNIVSIGASLYSAGSSVKNMAEFASEGSTKTYARYDFSAEYSMMKSSRHAGMAFDTGQASSSDPWHEENGMTVSDEGDNIYTLITYVECTFDTKIELKGNLWNNGKYQGQGMHSYQLYNTYKNYGGRDAALRAGEVRIPTNLFGIKTIDNGQLFVNSIIEKGQNVTFGSSLIAQAFETSFSSASNYKPLYAQRGVSSLDLANQSLNYAKYSRYTAKVGGVLTGADLLLSLGKFSVSKKDWGDKTELGVNLTITGIGQIRHPAAQGAAIGLGVFETAGGFDNLYNAARFADNYGILGVPTGLGSMKFIKIR